MAPKKAFRKNGISCFEELVFLESWGLLLEFEVLQQGLRRFQTSFIKPNFCDFFNLKNENLGWIRI
jgi:hypothetical protein